MLSGIVDKAIRLKSYALLEHRIPDYMGRADYYRQCAIRYSFVKLLEQAVSTDTKGFDLIDVTETTAITLPNGNQIEFAIDSNGVCFARIKDGKCYPIDTKFLEYLLEMSREYKLLSGSFLRRLLREPRELTLRPNEFQVESAILDLHYVVSRWYFEMSSLGGLEEAVEGLKTVRKSLSE